MTTPPIDRLAYTVSQLAKALGLSDQQIYNHIRAGDLTPKYSGTKQIIPVKEAQRFIDELPDENRGPLS